MKLALENGKSRTLRLRMSLIAITSRSGWSYGSGRSRTAFATLKMAVLAPTPKAIVRMAVSAKTGLFRSVRAARASSRMSIVPSQIPALTREEYHAPVHLRDHTQRAGCLGLIDYIVAGFLGKKNSMAAMPAA